MSYQTFCSDLEKSLLAYGLPGHFRQRPECVKHAHYLATPVHHLSAEARDLKIGQAHLFSLKRSEDLGPKEMVDQYNELFGPGLKGCAFGNTSFVANLLRGFYDLSLRHPPEGLKEKCCDLALGYAGFIGIPEVKQCRNMRDIITYLIPPFINMVDTFFTIDDGVKKVLEASIRRGVLRNQKERPVPASALSVLDDFIYRAPNPGHIEALMGQFYERYSNRGAAADLIQEAAWIIHNFCMIHPFADGNGRLARKLCFDFLSQHHQPEVSFNQQEVIDYGQDPAYIAATTRSEKPGGLDAITAWVQAVVDHKLQPALRSGP